MNNIHISMTEFTNASRVLKQTRSLVDNNIFDKIDIIALGNDQLPKHEKVSDEISIHRIKLISKPLPKHLLFQLIKYLEFTIRTLQLAHKSNSKAINAHSLSVLPIAYIFKLLSKSYLIYDTHELETERNGLSGVKKKLSKVIEKVLINYTDLNFVVSESIADWYDTTYKISRPTVVLNTPKTRSLKNNNVFREQLNISSDQVIFLYQGGLTTGRGIEKLLNAFKARTDSKCVIVFMGYGFLSENIKKASNDFDNIYYFPAVHPNVLLEYTSSADVGISLIENNCLSYYYCMPNKLFEYAMAGLPVLVSNMKDMSELVIKNDMGTVISNFTPAGINKDLDGFLKKDLTQMKENAYRIAIENTWDIQEKKMVSAYKNMLDDKGVS